MKLYSTNSRKRLYDLREAVLLGLAPDGGLFMPDELPRLSSGFLSDLQSYSFPQLCEFLAVRLFNQSIPKKDISTIIKNSITFRAPVIPLTNNLHVMELWHGPSLAFKDFGAQFMAQLMAYFNRDQNKALNVLVATSGDTGSAVAAGFHNVPGINVIILFPKGKVSALQEKQLTTFDNNIHALEIDGSFDDCQALVKQAFNDKELTRQIRFTSANSINIARLIPQMFYYFEPFRLDSFKQKELSFSVPSGNFGNLTAGLFAKKMGLPVKTFVASTNINRVVPDYLDSGKFEARTSRETISNAMDVGNPSNFARIMDLYSFTWNHVKGDIKGYSFNDQQTLQAIKAVHSQYNYYIDPHGAVAYLGASQYLSNQPNAEIIILETAHPSKFKDVMDRALSTSISLHPILSQLQHLPSTKTTLSSNFSSLSTFLRDTFSS